MESAILKKLKTKWFYNFNQWVFKIIILEKYLSRKFIFIYISFYIFLINLLISIKISKINKIRHEQTIEYYIVTIFSFLLFYHNNWS